MKAELYGTLARRVRLMPTAEVQAVLPNIGKRQLTDLRNEKPGFGWERLNTIAIRLGVDVASIWANPAVFEYRWPGSAPFPGRYVLPVFASGAAAASEA